VNELFRRKGLEYIGGTVDREAYKQSQYDILADSVRKNLDMELIYKIIREGI
jgi:adenosylcobyric acid synthase